MTRKEVFKAVSDRFPGDEWVSSLAELDRKTGLQKAREYLNRAHLGQENAKSDWAYYGWGNDIALATIVGAIFKYEGEEYPELPSPKGMVLMDWQAYLTEWAAQLLSDHTHEYESCSHKKNEKGSHPVCSKVLNFGLYHYVCIHCGRQKYSSVEI